MSSRNHSHFQDLLEQHVSGAPLSPPDRLLLFDHIEDCNDCREILEAESRITQRMKAVPRLIAPSDLRSKILSQAVRDHRERTTTPSEDPAIADLLRARVHAEEEVAAGDRQILPPTRRPEQPGARKIPATPSQPGSADLPVFAGIARPAPSRLRRVWRKASPVLATTFLSVAAVVALYSGQFQAVPLAGEAQQLVWAVVHGIQGTSTDEFQLASNLGPAPGRAGIGSPPKTAVSALTVAVETAGSSDGKDAAEIASVSPATTPVSPASPLPGTSVVVDWMDRIRSLGVAADSTLVALTQAADNVPAPAEKARPQIAALVLRATDRDAVLGGFRDSELAAELESVTRNQPGGRVARQDQFAMDGHRYRLYTLDLPAGFANRMVETLTPYECPADGVIVNALVSQRPAGTAGHGGSVQFYSSEESRLRSALQRIEPVAGTPSNREQVRVVLVD